MNANNRNNNTTGASERIHRVVPSSVPSNDKFRFVTGSVIKHDLADIRKKAKGGIFVRYNDERAAGHQWYLEAYLEGSLDLAQKLLKQAEQKYLNATKPRPQARRTAVPTHQNQFSALEKVDAKKQAKKQRKQAQKNKEEKFDKDFPSLAPSAVAPAPTPVWVRNTPKPATQEPQPQLKPQPKTQMVVLGPTRKVVKPEPEVDDWETEAPALLEVPASAPVNDWWGGDFYNRGSGAY